MLVKNVRSDVILHCFLVQVYAVVHARMFQSDSLEFLGDERWP